MDSLDKLAREIVWSFNYDRVGENDSELDREGAIRDIKAALLSTRNRTIEECAKVAENEQNIIGDGQAWGAFDQNEADHKRATANAIAQTIRSLISGEQEGK